MKKGYLFAVVGTLSLVIFAGMLFHPGQVAQAATGCTCPTGCGTVTTITAPFSFSGVGEACWQSTELGSYIQSWGADSVQVTGVNYTNMYVVTDQMLRDTTGTYYVYYKSTTANGNFSANGSSGITGCHKAWCSAAQFGSMNIGQFTMFNNAWGAANGTGQMTQANSASDWSTFGTYPETGGVKSYPNASLDMNGKTISTLGSCTSSFNVTVPSSGSYETAYDIWVPSEIMLWMNKNGLVGPIAQGWNSDGTPIPAATNVTVGGHTWDVYHGGSNVVSFVRQGNISSGTVDILAILNWTASQGWISNTSNLGKFQFGFEITSAPGGLNFVNNSYSINCGGLGGGVTPMPTSTPARTATRTNTPSGPTATRTNTPIILTATATRTNTPIGPTATRTNTPVGPTATRTNTPMPPTATRTNTPVGPTATPGGSDPCASPTVLTGGGSFNIGTSATCFKYVNAANKWGGMFTVMNGSSSAVNTLKWYGGRSETVTSCINDSQTLTGNGAQLNNFTVGKDSSGAMYLTITGNAANTVSISIQNWQNGTGCSVAPTPHP